MLQVGDRVLGPYKVLNAARKEVVLTIKEVDVMPEETARNGVRYVNCSYTLHDAEHVETFREDSLRSLS